MSAAWIAGCYLAFGALWGIQIAFAPTRSEREWQDESLTELPDRDHDGVRGFFVLVCMLMWPVMAAAIVGDLVRLVYFTVRRMWR